MGGEILVDSKSDKGRGQGMAGANTEKGHIGDKERGNRGET